MRQLVYCPIDQRYGPRSDYSSYETSYCADPIPSGARALVSLGTNGDAVLYIQRVDSIFAEVRESVVDVVSSKSDRSYEEYYATSQSETTAVEY